MAESSPLLDLAWASLSEEAIVAKCANECLRNGYRWRTGYKGEIRDCVNRTRPVRGGKKSRLEAVIREIDRQREIYGKRQHNQPIDWAKWRPAQKDRRRLAVCNYITGGGYSSCLVLRRWSGHIVMICSGGYRDNEIVIQHPGGRIDRVSVSGPVDHGTSALQHALQHALASLWRPEVKNAILRGAAISYDFCKLATVIYTPGERPHLLPWEERTAAELKKAGKKDTRPPCKVCE